MQGCERRVLFESCKNVLIDHDRLIVLRPAMDDPVANRGRLELLRFAQPGAGSLECRRNILQLLGWVSLINQLYLVRALRAQPRLRSDAVHLPFDQALWPRRVRRKYLELDARRTGVDDKDRTHRGQAFGRAALLRRASA